MKNFILTSIFAIGVLLPVLAIIMLSPNPQTTAQSANQAAIVGFAADEFEPNPPVISYDFSRGHIPSAQFMALTRETHSDGAVSIHIILPYLIHPDFWVEMFRKLPCCQIGYPS